MIMRFDLEGAGPAIANVDDAGILPRALHNQFAASWQPLEMNSRRFIRAVLAPHHAENAQLGERGFASTQQALDFVVLIGSQAVLPNELRGDVQSCRRSHWVGKLYCRIWRQGLGRAEI